MNSELDSEAPLKSVLKPEVKKCVCKKKCNGLKCNQCVIMKNGIPILLGFR